MSFKVFNVTFKNISELFQTLGYTSSQSKANVAKNYGSYEMLVRTRLHMKDADDASVESALRDLLERKKHDMSASADCLYISRSVADVLKACYKALDAEKRDTIISAIAVTRDTTADIIKASIEEL